MRKILFCMVFLCALILVSCQKAEIPKTEITETEAVELAKSHIEFVETEDYIKLITNFDVPTVEKLDFDKSYVVYYFNERTAPAQENDLKGKQIWKITYNTTLDPMWGPHAIYIDRYSGQIYGTDLRV